MGDTHTKEYYNSMPVLYCENCLSLNIKSMSEDEDTSMLFCDQCGCTNISTCTIEDWENLNNSKNFKKQSNGRD